MMRRARILVIGDDEEEAESSKSLLEQALHVARACLPGEAREQVETFRPDLVVTALRNSDTDALERVVRAVQSSYRPLVLGVVSNPASVTGALEAGADACLTRPYDTHDLEVHVRALLRRVPWTANAVHQVGSLVVDEASHLAMFDDTTLALTGKEFGILVTLARETGRVVSKRTLLERLWGFEAYDENLVEAHVSGLRRHLPPPAAAMVQTVRGVGYVLRPERAQVRPA